MNEEQMKQIADETFHFINNKGVGFICYFWDRDGGYSGGCNCAEFTVEDVLAAIEGLVKHFNIDTERLYKCIDGSKT